MKAQAELLLGEEGAEPCGELMRRDVSGRGGGREHEQSPDVSSIDQPRACASAVIVGELVGIGNDGRSPLIVYPGQPGTAALIASSVVDLHGAHIGRSVVLSFESGDPAKPIVMGLVREDSAWPLEEQPGQIEVDVDGQRLVITAQDQLVLRCGSASITLTRAGKVLIQGAYVLSRSSGPNRIKGGSVELN
jgi:Domain of unknown function (DUF6484)